MKKITSLLAIALVAFASNAQNFNLALGVDTSNPAAYTFSINLVAIADGPAVSLNDAAITFVIENPTLPNTPTANIDNFTGVIGTAWPSGAGMTAIAPAAGNPLVGPQGLAGLQNEVWQVVLENSGSGTIPAHVAGDEITIFRFDVDPSTAGTLRLIDNSEPDAVLAGGTFANVLNIGDGTVVNDYNTSVAGTDGVTSYPLTTLSTQDIKNAQLGIFPNPSNGQFQITGLTAPIAVNVFDMNGKLVHRVDSYENGEITTNNLNAGVYLVELRTENGQTNTQKLIIK